MVLKRFPYSVPPDLQEDYLVGIHALEDSTEPGSLIGSTGGGVIGYFIKDRTIVNLDGLINSPEYFSLLKIGHGAVFLDRMGLDYVFGSETVLTQSDPYSEIFANHLLKVDYKSEGTLYRYIP
jgi:hypothetical protein